jgi:hypothetical protein
MRVMVCDDSVGDACDGMVLMLVHNEDSFVLL